MGRALRWLITIVVGVAGFGLVWWLTEAGLRLDPGTATNVGVAFASLLAAPFAWWASRETGHQSPGPGPVPAAPGPDAAAGHVFICYSRRADQQYVKRLAAFLDEHGVPCWFDQKIPTGYRWEEVIREKIDTCAALVVVMTPEAEASRWVAREIAHAERRQKAVLPLLLDGQEFFRLSDVQYEDVRGGRMPDATFLTRLWAYLPEAEPVTVPQPSPLDGAQVPVPPAPSPRTTVAAGGPDPGPVGAPTQMPGQTPAGPPQTPAESPARLLSRRPARVWRWLTAAGLVAVILIAGAVYLVGRPDAEATGSGSHASGSVDPSRSGSPPSRSATPAGAVLNPSTKKGGTLKLLNAEGSDSWDPAIAYYAWEWNLQRLYLRTLVSAQPKPGRDGVTLVNDLAQSQDISADGLTYTYRLRSGTMFEDGTPITSKDIKYGIERVFDQGTLNGGPTYLIDQLDQGQHYPGPYKDVDPNKLGLRSVDTPDDATIVFHLKQPFADFPYLLAMGGASPVPQAKDTGVRYTDHPIASGPYMFQTIQRDKVVLVRNPHWDASTDPIRKALPDEVDLALNVNSDEIDNELLAGTADLAVDQAGVGPAARSRILADPQLRKNVDETITGGLRYLAISAKVPPFDNVHCRMAVQYAVDKVAVQTARGGPDAGGAIGTSMLPPTNDAYDPDLAPYTGTSGQPDVAKAKDELAECGQPDGFHTVIAVRNLGTNPGIAEAVQASLARLGIVAAIDRSDPDHYYSSGVGSPTNVHGKGYGLMVAGWYGDFPTGYGFLDPLVDGTQIRSISNPNLAEIDDPVIQGLIAQAAAATDPARAAQIWGQINAKVMDSAALVPLLYDRLLNYHNPRLTNVYVDGYFGMVDLQALGTG